MKRWVIVLAVYIAALATGYAQIVTENATSIIVAGRTYHLVIHKADASTVLTDETGRKFCTFPLWADGSPVTMQQHVSFAWSIVDTTISYLASDADGTPHVKCRIACGQDAFGAEFTVRHPDTMNFVRYRQSWEVLCTYGPFNTGSPSFDIGGHHYSKGLWTHAVSNIHIPIPAHVVAFESDFGREDSEPYPSKVQFAVSLNDSERFRSDIMGLGDPPQHVHVNIGRETMLTLTVLDGNDGYAHDHADWTVPVFITDTGDTIDVVQLVYHSQESVNYFTLNGSGMRFPQGWAIIWNSMPDCEMKELINHSEISASGNLCGYAFNPSPTMMSFKSVDAPAWIGIGLTALPNAGSMIFDDNHYVLNTIFTKLPPDTARWYALPGVCFVFDSVRYHNNDHYYEYLRSHHFINERDSSFMNHPAWWDKLTVCPWGDQAVRLFNQGIGTTQAWVADYLDRAEVLYRDSTFTFLIDDQWRKRTNDPEVNTAVYPNLRALIDTAHHRGHHVMLQWPFWPAADSSLACKMHICQIPGVNAGSILDATDPLYETFADSVLRAILSPEGLNADGLKMDFLSFVRDPGLGIYGDPRQGMGMQEQLMAAKKWTAIAKRIKPDCLLTYTIANPFFNDVVDKIRTNDNGNPWSQYQLRARTASQMSPYAFLDSDGWQLRHEDMEPYYFGACVFGTPAPYYMDHYRDIPRVDSTEELLAKLFGLYRFKQFGQAKFREGDGSWSCVRHDTVMAQSEDSNSVFIVRCSAESCKVLARTSMLYPIPMYKHQLLDIKGDDGAQVIRYLGQDTVWLYAYRGVTYTLTFDSSAGVQERALQPDLMVFPNPATHQINILAGGTDAEPVIYNAVGDRVSPHIPYRSIGASETYYTFSTTNLPAGMYVLRMRSGATEKHSRFVVLPH